MLWQGEEEEEMEPVAAVASAISFWTVAVATAAKESDKWIEVGMEEESKLIEEVRASTSISRKMVKSISSSFFCSD